MAGVKYDIIVQLHAPASEAILKLFDEVNVKHVIVAEILPREKNLNQWLRHPYSNRFSFIKMLQYEMVLFFDADVVFTGNPDVLFEQNLNHYDCVASGDFNSPVNGGFVLVKPSWQAYVDIEDIVNTGSFRRYMGILSVGPRLHYVTGAASEWAFSSCDGYQGMLYYYYFRRPDHPPSKLWGDRGTPNGWIEADKVAVHFQGEKAFNIRVVAKNMAPDRKTGMARWSELKPRVIERMNRVLGEADDLR